MDKYNTNGCDEHANSTQPVKCIAGDREVLILPNLILLKNMLSKKPTVL